MKHRKAPLGFSFRLQAILMKS